MSNVRTDAAYVDALQRVMTRAAVSIDDAAMIFGVSRNSAFKAAAAGQIQTVNIGRLKKVPTAKLRAMLGIADPAEQVAA